MGDWAGGRQVLGCVGRGSCASVCVGVRGCGSEWVLSYVCVRICVHGQEYWCCGYTLMPFGQPQLETRLGWCCTGRLDILQELKAAY